MNEGKKLVYSGDLLRKFLHQKKLTYKEAAKELGLDKNTIGKAVRGGNMNINVLLKISLRGSIMRSAENPILLVRTNIRHGRKMSLQLFPKPLKSIKILKIHQSKNLI